ncbi:hypothetical protein [Mucilaginibacter sp. AK015]|uniref:hypothetical protein n=1 Tax=Mucilaginibacter sp. AK015 TaxID=2723072 RepID=UPI00161C6E44|nr:hypothetical protein [Mucilaginibacter sp. AK015]MBB5394890.1 hypothetical protein [Mucilaginibacter sp. AK015]
MRKITLILFILAGWLTANGQGPQRKWFEGTVYHTSGEIFDGLISWQPPHKGEYADGDQILYTANEHSEVFPIPYYKIKSFVMGADSFVVSHNVLFKNNPFMIVSLDNPTKLFTLKTAKNGFPLILNTGGGGGNFGVGVGIATTVGGGTRTTYYYGTNKDNVAKLEKKQFIEVMSNIMADKPDVVAKIKDKTFRYGDMEDLLTYYKTGQMPKRSYDY